MNLLEFMVDLNNPPGTIKAFAKDVDPNKIYPWQTWERYAKGRTLVGVDEDDEDFATAGLELGEKEHQLIAEEMPKHHHLLRGVAISRNTDGYVAARSYTFSSLDTTGQTSDTGGDQPHNNIQPSTTVYYWRRVS